jgi:hypothetical protein
VLVAPPPVPVPPPPSRTEVVVSDAVDRAFRHVYTHDRGCRPHTVRLPPVIPGEPPAGVPRALSVLAGGASAATQFFATPVMDAPPGIYGDSVRRVRVLAHGQAIYVLAVRFPGATAPLPARCDREELARVRRLLAGRGRVLRVALRRDRRLLRDRRRELTRAHVHVCLFLRDRLGFVSGGCDSVPHIRRQGIGDDDPSGVGILLVPDGVASVDSYFVRPRSRRFIRIRRQVRGNVVAFTEPRGALEPYGDVWRAADGHIVNTVCALRCLASG